MAAPASHEVNVCAHDSKSAFYKQFVKADCELVRK